MKLIFCFASLLIITFSSCVSSIETKYSEGISGNSLKVFSKIDLYMISGDEGDDDFENKLLEIINRRAIFLLAAYGEKNITRSKEIADYATLLNEKQLTPKILYKNYSDDYLYVWVEYDILPFVELLNNANKR